MKGKRKRTMYALVYDGPPVAVKVLEQFGSEIGAMVTSRDHERYAKGALVVVGIERIAYRTRGGRFFEAPREDIIERIEENEKSD